MKTQNPPAQSFIVLAAQLFKNKEEYVAWRKQWKADYAMLSDEIRRTKLEIRQTMKDRGYAGHDQVRLIKLRRCAYDSIELLRAAKMEAQRQYLESRDTKSSTAA